MTGGKVLVFAHHRNVLDALEQSVVRTGRVEYIRIDGRTKVGKYVLYYTRSVAADDWILDMASCIGYAVSTSMAFQPRRQLLLYLWDVYAMFDVVTSRTGRAMLDDNG